VILRPRLLACVGAAALGLGSAAPARGVEDPTEWIKEVSDGAPEPHPGREFMPIYGFQMMGGQNFYTGEQASLSGNANGFFAPAMRLNDEWSVLPSLSSNYMGTRQVLDLVAGGSLFSSSWDNALTVKALYAPTDSPWRIKPHGDFKYEFLREAAGENLGQGLYDYMQWDVGADAEYVYRDPYALNFGIDYYGRSPSAESRRLRVSRT